MRDIEFRYWDKYNKFMDYKDIHAMINGRMGSNLNLEYLMQYTGLKDKGGKKIFEGDILTQERKFNCNCTDCKGEHFEKTLGIVTYTECASFLLKVINKESATFYIVIYPFFEIIGNVFENPELLENQSQGELCL